MRVANDNRRVGGAAVFQPSTLAVFLPVLAIAAGYGLFWAALWVSGRSHGTIAHLCVAVLVIATPMLAAHALLRALTLRVRVMPRAVLVHRGFPSGAEIALAYSDIASVHAMRGKTARFTGSGALVIDLIDRARITIGDLVGAERAAETICLALGERRRSMHQPAPNPGAEPYTAIRG